MRAHQNQQRSGISLESVEKTRADGKIAETRRRTSGEVATFEVELDGDIRCRLNADSTGAAVNKFLAVRSVTLEPLIAEIPSR